MEEAKTKKGFIWDILCNVCSSTVEACVAVVEVV